MNGLSEVDFKARTPHPMLGPALWVSGTALWAYVVAGELVVAKGFPEPLALFGLLFAVGVSWFFAIEQSFRKEQPTPETRSRRLWAPLGIAFALWMAVTLLAAVIGLTSRDDIDALLTIGLWLLSLFPFFIGRRMTRSGQPSAQDSARRALGILLWLGAVLITLVALLPIVR